MSDRVMVTWLGEYYVNGEKKITLAALHFTSYNGRDGIVGAVR